MNTNSYQNSSCAVVFLYIKKMKTVIAPLFFIVTVFPKQLSSVNCCGTSAINIPANLYRGRFPQKKVGLDETLEYVIGFVKKVKETERRTQHGTGRGTEREIERRTSRRTGSYFILTPMMAQIPELDGGLGNIKLLIEGESARHYEAIISGDHILDMYFHEFDELRIRPARLVHALNIPNTAAVALPVHANLPSVQASPSRVQASPSHVHANYPSVQANPSYVYTNYPRRQAIPLSMFSSSLRDQVPPVLPR